MGSFRYQKKWISRAGAIITPAMSVEPSSEENSKENILMTRLSVN